MQKYNFFCIYNENICINNEDISTMTTKERILQLASDNGLMKTSLLKKCGLRRGFLDTDKMDGAVTDKQLAAILAAFPQVNLEWLITGDGQMYKPTTVLPTDTVSLDRYEQIVRDNERLRLTIENQSQCNHNHNV